MTDNPLDALRAEFEAFREASARRETIALREAEQLREIVREYKAAQPVPGVVRPDEPNRFFYRQDLRDTAFFAEHRGEILRAVAAGRILPDPDKPDWRVGTTPKGSRP
jgi:hypothetical protein